MVDSGDTSARAAQTAHSASSVEDLLGCMLLSAGSVIAVAGMLAADGTELAIGPVMLAAGLRHAAQITLTPRDERAAFD